MLNSEVNSVKAPVISFQPLMPMLLGDQQVVTYQDYANNLQQLTNFCNSILQNLPSSQYRIAQVIGAYSVSQVAPTNGQTLKFDASKNMWIPG